MLIVGTEWLIEASGCDARALRDAARLGALVEGVVAELELRVVGEARWHKFPGAGGVTGLVLLSESHLACHTYPEFGVATFNLYCCRSRPRWPWEERLGEALGAERVTVREFERAVDVGGGDNADAVDGYAEASSEETRAGVCEEAACAGEGAGGSAW